MKEKRGKKKLEREREKEKERAFVFGVLKLESLAFCFV